MRNRFFKICAWFGVALACVSYLFGTDGWLNECYQPRGVREIHQNHK